MIRVFEQATEYIRRGEPCALVTVVQTSGSVPRHAGAKMLVNAQGAIVAGTIGGGEMESRASQLAQQAIADGKSRTATYHLADLQRGDPGVCGGTVEVFIEPLLPAPTLLVVGAGHVGRALVRLANRRYWQRATLGSGRPGPARAGVSESDLQRIHAPIGIEIRAETPEEIAVSIMAQIIQVWRAER